LSADGIADRILEEVDRFSGGRHPFDDRTLVVLKVASSVGFQNVPITPVS
jgi:serine phosphatase RsbU (regulator of sigma subunit)